MASDALAEALARNMSPADVGAGEDALDLLALSPDEIRRRFPGVTVVRTAAEARLVLRVLRSLVDGVVACDVESSDIDLGEQSPYGNGRVICLSLYAGPDVDFGNGPRVWVDTTTGAGETLRELRPFFESASGAGKVWHNYSFDRAQLANHGICARGFAGDTLHMARLWDSSRLGRGYSLEALSADVLGARKRPMTELFSLPKPKQDGTAGRQMQLPALDRVQRSALFLSDWVQYSTYDTQATWQLYGELARRLALIPWITNGLPGRARAGDSSEPSMLEFYKRHWLAFGEVLTDIERAGVYVRLDHLAASERIAQADRDRAEAEFLAWAETVSPGARRMNPRSQAQKQQLLFAPCVNVRTGATLERARAFKIANTEGLVEPGKKKALKQRELTITGLGIPASEHTELGWPSVSADAVRSLAGKIRVRERVDEKANAYGSVFGFFKSARHSAEAGHAAAIALDALANANAIDTLLSSFIRPLQTMADEASRVHCSLNLNTETGRLSARLPNLQNQPALEKDRYRTRHAFAAPSGRSLIVADYGQVELRVLAHLTDCASMIEAFEAGGDFHSRTALSMYEHVASAVAEGRALMEWHGAAGERPPVPLVKDVFGSERRKAKTLNFSIAYGKTAVGLAKDWGVSRDEAQATLQRWYANRQEVLRWQQDTIAAAHRNGFTTTLLGRRRILPHINSTDRYWRGHSERAAINTPIQGGAADIVAEAMLGLARHARLAELRWRMVLQVHDEIILEGPSESAAEALELVRDVMAHPFERPLRVALEVDAKIAGTWYEAK